MTGPLVLVVEDDPQALALRVRQLQTAGCRAIPVSNSDDAIRQIWHSPLLGAVLTDINLVRHGEDRSGIALARYIRQNRPQLPVSGYSGVFAEDRLSADELQLFDTYYGAGRLSPKEIRKAMAEVMELAQRFEVIRRQEAEERLDQLRMKEGVSREDFETFRGLVPDQELATEQVLADANLHAQIVGPGAFPTDSPTTTENTDSGLRIVVPMIVWIRDGDNGSAEAEVHGVPELYAYGESRDAAVANVMRLAAAYYKDLLPAREVSGPVARLRAFLMSVFAQDGRQPVGAN